MKRMTVFFSCVLIAGCVTKSQYDETLTSYHDISTQLTRTTKERDQCKLKATDLERRVSELEERNQELSNTNQILLSKNRDYVEKTIASQKEVLKFKKEQSSQDEKSAALDRLYQELTKALKSEISEGIAKIQKTDGEIRALINDSAFFSPGTIQIHKDGNTIIRRIAKSLSRLSGQKLYVESHSDGTPLSAKQKKAFGTHWELTSLRATRLVRALESQGLPSKALAAVGYGPNRPIASSEVHEGRMKNRRIEFVIIQD